MMRRSCWAALALMAGTALTTGGLATSAHAQGGGGKVLAPLTATPVQPSPIHTIPTDSGPTDLGDSDNPNLERQEATAPGNTLNDQLASLAKPAATPVSLVTAAPTPVEMIRAQQAQDEAQQAQFQQAQAQAQPAEPEQGADPAEADPAAAPRAGPSVAIARRFVDAAGAFERYMRLASSVRADFGGGDAVTRALDVGATYEQTQLEEGAIAYGALAALQDPAFVQALGQLSPDPNARMAVAAQLIADPEAVMQTPGARSAAGRASAAIGHMGGALFVAGSAVKQAAYDVQHQPWSRTAPQAPEIELAHIKSVSTARLALKSEDTSALMSSLVEMRKSAAGSIDPGPISPVVARSLALAALAVLGEADEAHADQVSSLLDEAKSAECVKMVRLNLYQCLSVAGAQYEDVFCLGQHAMMDTAQCVVSASGWRPAVAPGSVAVPIAMPQAAPRPAPVMVPVALAVEPGVN
jgi:hypothetical protein